MDPIDLELKNALTRPQPIPAAELALLNRRIVATYVRKQKGFFRLMTAYLGAMTLLMLVLFAMFHATTDLKQCLLLGIIILILFEGTVLMKLWYWTLHGKIAMLREIKLLQLAIAELKTPQSAAQAEAAASFPDENSLEPSVMPQPSSPRTWSRILTIPVWLLAVAGVIYFGWLQGPSEPWHVTPYFEKTVSPANGEQGREWQQTFEVAETRQRFYPRLLAASKTARVWISVGAEGQEPVYVGPVDTGTRISFGHPTPGRYIVKGRVEQADGDLKLRIGGVDEVPGGPGVGRYFFLMLSAALTIALPLVWLQNRWLRRIDPELERELEK